MEYKKFLKFLKKKGLLEDFFETISEGNGIRWYGEKNAKSVISYVQWSLRNMSVRKFVLNDIILSNARGRAGYYASVLCEWKNDVETIRGRGYVIKEEKED